MQYRPRPLKRINHPWTRVSKNPSHWKSPYSVEVKDGAQWLIFSQHRLLNAAATAAKKVTKKYKSGHEALMT